MLGVLGRITIQSVFILAALVVLMIISVQITERDAIAPSIKLVASTTPDVTAKAWGVVDIMQNDLVLSENSTEMYPIASVTKLITAATLRANFDTAATTTITWQDVAAEGRAGSLVPGDEMILHTLLFPLLLESSNDAAAALEHSFDEGELVLAMNDFVAQRDLQGTVFKDASGLSPENKSTVRNLASLATDLYFEQPHLLDISAQKEHLFERYGWHNTSPFINDPTYKGGKQGYIPEANRTVVAYFEERYPEGRALVAYILLGSDDLVADIDALRAMVHEHTVYQ